MKLSEKVQNIVDSLVARNYGAEPPREPKAKTIDAVLANVNEEVDIKRRDFIKYLRARNETLTDRSEIFNPHIGVASNFAIHKSPMGDLISGGNKFVIVDKTINKIKETPIENVLLSVAAINKKEQLIELLNDAKTNAPNPAGDEPFTEDELEVINKLLSILEQEEPEAYTHTKSEFEALKEIERTLVNVNALSTNERDGYYKYWHGIHESFEKLAEYFDNIGPFLENIIPFIEQFDTRTETVKELSEAMRDIKLPNYVLQLAAVENKELVEESKINRLVYEFLKSIGKQLPKSLEAYETQSKAAGKILDTVREERDFPEEGVVAGVGGSFDPTAADDLVDDIEEAERKFKKEIVKMDPIFLLLIENNKINEDYTDNVIEKAKEQIKENFNYTAGPLLETIESILDGEIDTFLDNYKKSQALIIEGHYYMPVIGESISIDVLDRAYISIDVDYIDYYGEVHEENFTQEGAYREAVNFVNTNTRKFFKKLGEILKITSGSIPILTKVRTARGASKSPSLNQGGTSIPLPTKMTQKDVDRMNDLDEILQLITEYYIEPLSGKYVFLDDVPEFYESDEFKEFPKILSGSKTAQARKTINRGIEPLIDSADYQNVIDFMKAIRRPDELYYDADLVNLFQRGLESYINFWQGVAIESEEETPLQDIIEEVTAIFGDSLYEIAMDSFKNPETVKEKRWSGKSLPEWNKIQKENNYKLDNLLGLLESREYVTYVEENMGQRGKLRTKHDALVGMLKSSGKKLAGPITHAMLEATDIIRKMNNKKIYISNMDIDDIDNLSYVINKIKKEDDIDIYGVDIYNIVNSQSSFNTIAAENGISSELVYKIKGLFR